MGREMATPNAGGLQGPSGKPTDTAATALPRVRSEHGFPVVGIGASAGGLAAFEEFLSALPTDKPLGMAFVLAQHLDPDHKSILLELVSRYTTMEVQWAEDGIVVRPECAYVMPPNKDMVLVDGHLVLMKPEAPRGLRLPIDTFFRSLASDQHERAICIVLSGTGSDGTLGARAVSDEGGLVIVQSPESAGYDGMPASVICAGMVDHVLAPKDMPEQLLDYVSHGFHRLAQLERSASNESSQELLKVLHLLRDRTGHDFTHYRTPTLLRRVERRMAVTKIDDMAEYVDLVGRDTREAETLFRELLIGVTSFFRDAAAYEVLAAEVIPGLVAAHTSDNPVRVWVPGCSTGEEAYSLAMLLLEQTTRATYNVPVQVFATDIDVDAIEHARNGVYPASIAADVSPERLARFFTQDGENYRLVKSVRDSLVFAEQDVIKDPPFSRVDLISCRNLLISMNPELQQRLMLVFHYAINPGGYLFLGSSETVGAADDLYSPVNRKWKLFRRRDADRSQPPIKSGVPPLGMPVRTVGHRKHRAIPMSVRVRELAEKALLDKHVPPCAVINAKGDVLHIHGHTGRYLELAPGAPSGSIFKMARDGLRRELASGVRKVQLEGKPVRYEHLRVRTNGDTILVNLTIEPLFGAETISGVMLVLFEDVDVGDDLLAAANLEPVANRKQLSADMDRELTAKEEYLHTAVDELETSNEELQSANEEFHSINEELATSREELQSVNEELITVNSELRQKITELSYANADMNNMMAGTDIGTLFVDRQQLIRRFTPRVTEILRLIPADIGRPLGDIAPRVQGDVSLVGAVTTVLDTLVTVEDLIVSDERMYQMRAQPYRTIDNVIEGAVLTFVDVSEQRHLQARLDEASDAAALAGTFAQSVLDTVREPQLVLDGELKVVTANVSFIGTFQSPLDQIVGFPLGDLYDGEWLTPELTDLLLEVLPRKRKLGDFELLLTSGVLGQVTITLNALELVQTPGKRRLILLTVTDIGGVT